MCLLPHTLNSKDCVRFEILAAVTVKIAGFWAVVLRILVVSEVGDSRFIQNGHIYLPSYEPHLRRQ
jgi:uncharacterized membrane protein YpjA